MRQEGYGDGEERLTREDEEREMESGEVKVDRDGEGSLTKRVKKERWRVMRSRLSKMASPRGGPRDNEV